MLSADVDELVMGLSEASRVVKAKGEHLDLFRVAYHAATSLKTYCVDFSDRSGDSPHGFEARLLSLVEGEKVVKRIKVAGGLEGIELKVWGSSKEKAEKEIGELAQKVEETLSRIGKMSSENVQKFHSAVTIERKLDMSLNRLLTGATRQQVYFDLADARERIILLLGHFDSSIIQMEKMLEDLTKLDKDAPIKKEVGEKMALEILKWKRKISDYISQLK